MDNQVRSPLSVMQKGKAANFIREFSVKPGDRFIVLCRVSSTAQGKRYSLDGQAEFLPKAVLAAGGTLVCDPIQIEWSGRGRVWLRRELAKVVNLARKHNAILLAATTDRFIRSYWFRPTSRKRAQAQAQYADLMELQTAAQGVVLMTYLHPDASPGECKSLLTSWAMKAKGQRGPKCGRPRKPDTLPGWRSRRKAAVLPIVLSLSAQGKSSRDIANEVLLRSGSRVSHTTISAWISESSGCKVSPSASSP